jgi:tetratricopeptide (TPR) repeat protein
MEEELMGVLSLRQAADRTGLPVWRLRKDASRGVLSATMVGATWATDDDRLNDYLRRMREPTPGAVDGESRPPEATLADLGGSPAAEDALIARLASGFGQDDEGLLMALDRAAPRMVSLGRHECLMPHVDRLRRLDFGLHPWACLLVAKAVYSVDHEPGPAQELVAATAHAFRRGGDTTGQAYAEWVLGTFALPQGDLDRAAQHWRRTLELTGERGPLKELALANLALSVYQSGDVTESVKLAEEAIALAQRRANPRAEGVALIYRAFFALNAGDFGVAHSALVTAQRIFPAIARRHERYEEPLVYVARGTLLSLRGRHDEADQDFERAVALAEAIPEPWYIAMARTVWAEFTADRDPDRAYAELRWCIATFDQVNDRWWLSWAVRAQGIASRHMGRLAESEVILRKLLETPLNGLERGRTLLALGETMARGNRREEALDLLKESVDLLRTAGANYWVARALIALAEARAPGATRLRAQARELIDDRDAYRRLYGGRSRLVVNVLGEPAILVDDRRATFVGRRPALLIYMLALAGPAGLHWEEVAERLWPETPIDGTRRRHSLRNEFYEAHQGLGSGCWRLEREGELMRLDMTGARHDLAEARAMALTALRPPMTAANREAAMAARQLLEQPLLAGWPYEDWLATERNRCRGLVNRLTAAIEGT